MHRAIHTRAAAILAGVGAGIFPDVVTACRKFIALDKTCEPDAAHGAYYQKGHALYRELYQKLQGSYQELAKL